MALQTRSPLKARSSGDLIGGKRATARNLEATLLPLLLGHWPLDRG
jgi:hypothetical protein